MSMFRNELKLKAAKHHELMVDKYSADIAECIENTFLHTYPVKVFEKHNSPEIVVRDMDTVSAVFEYATAGQRAVLNFASYKNPGGMFLGGSSAQEEALCHESLLYETLSSFENTYYAHNRTRLNHGFYTSRALYTKNMPFMRDGKTVCTDVITCAAPNMRAVSYHPELLGRNTDILKSRARFVCQMAEYYNTEVLILGAWGCGVFRQDPYEVADAFKDCINDFNFKTVVFAIPDLASENGRAFCEVFEK